MKKKTTKPNIPLLRKIQKAIVKHSDQFYMGWWFDRTVLKKGVLVSAGGCGTAGCIAGWAIRFGTKSKTMEEAKFKANTDPRDTATIAAKLLDIPITKSPICDLHPLFFVDQWPKEFRRMHDKAGSSDGEALAAAARIEHFIKTGE